MSKLMYTIKYVILFLIFSSPMTYKVTRSIFGGFIANQYGLSSTSGLLIHAALFGAVIYFLMGKGKDTKSAAPSNPMSKLAAGTDQNSIMPANLN
jgi:hypothetical protein